MYIMYDGLAAFIYNKVSDSDWLNCHVQVNMSNTDIMLSNTYEYYQSLSSTNCILVLDMCWKLSKENNFVSDSDIEKNSWFQSNVTLNFFLHWDQKRYFHKWWGHK